MGDVATLTGFAEPVALDGFGQYDRRGALMLNGGLVGRVNLLRVVTAAPQFLQLLIGVGLDHLG